MDIDRVRTVVLALFAVAVVVIAGFAVAQTFTDPPTGAEGEIPVAVDGGPEVVITTDDPADVNLDGSLWGNETLHIETEHGNIDVGGDNGSSATIDVQDISGSETVVTAISGGSEWLTLDPADKQRVDVRGDVDAVRFQSIGVNDGTHDLEFVGTDGGSIETSLYGLSANSDYVLTDPESGDILAQATADGNGTVTTDVTLSSANQEIAVRTPGDFAPIELTNPDPTGMVTETPDNLSVDVAAEAYPVDVTFYLDGSEVTTKTVTSSRTVTADLGGVGLGEHNWSVTATSDIGQTETIEESFQTPGQLTIREETTPSQVIDDATLTIRFYSVNGEIAIERQTSDGTLDMTGLPDSDFVVRIESDAEEYYDRTVYLDSIYQQSNIYVLNATAYPRGEGEAVLSRFVYTDLTGQFPRDETTIQLERAIDLNDDGESEFRVVAGDYWGAGGEFETTLEHGARYRMELVNRDTGQRQLIGTHIPTDDLTYEVRTSGLTQEAANATGVYADAQLDEDGGVIDIVYRDPTGDTDEVRFVVESRSGDTTLFDETIDGPLGTYTEHVALNESQLDENWVVKIESDRTNAAIPVGSGTKDLPVAVPPWLLTFLASMAVTFVGALYGPRTALLGAWAMVFVAAGISMFGWAFSPVSVLVAGLVAAAATFYEASWGG